MSINLSHSQGFSWSLVEAFPCLISQVSEGTVTQSLELWPMQLLETITLIRSQIKTKLMVGGHSSNEQRLKVKTTKLSLCSVKFHLR